MILLEWIWSVHQKALREWSSSSIMIDFLLIHVFHHDHVNIQGAPPMVFYDFSIPLVYGMAFLAMAFDKVTASWSLLMLLVVVGAISTEIDNEDVSWCGYVPLYDVCREYFSRSTAAFIYCQRALVPSAHFLNGFYTSSCFSWNFTSIALLHELYVNNIEQLFQVKTKKMALLDHWSVTSSCAMHGYMKSSWRS